MSAVLQGACQVAKLAENRHFQVQSIQHQDERQPNNGNFRQRLVCVFERGCPVASAAENLL
jgi:hypothetical protein